MPNWLWVVLIVVIAAIAVTTLMRMRTTQAQGRQSALESESATNTARDYSQEREDLRSSNLSAEDRAWETASLQRERDSRPKMPPAE
jgi:flagellar biosynthesis/type III secretory pathway M-ring protein FliF/YscJ